MSTRYQECVDECLACMKACNFCINACLIDDHMEPFAHCIHLTKDCADICSFVAKALSSQTNFKNQLCQVCAEICRVCSVECMKHAHTYQHCLRCAQACESCAIACDKVLEVY